MALNDRTGERQAIRLSGARPDDAALLHWIMQQAFAEFEGTLQPPSSALVETVADMERFLISGGAVIAWDGDAAIGFARYVPRGNRLYAGRVSVLPSHRRRGIASLLMSAIVREAAAKGCEEVEVEVRASLPSNVKLYQSLGFVIREEIVHPRDPTATFYMMTLAAEPT